MSWVGPNTGVNLPALCSGAMGDTPPPARRRLHSIGACRAVAQATGGESDRHIARVITLILFI
jgi:hypothetical protein